MINYLKTFLIILTLFSCSGPDETKVTYTDTVVRDYYDTTVSVPKPADIVIDNASPDDIVRFAERLIGVPYKYGSIDPAQGFDCSGFITYVFNHFNIKVPRSSIDFTNVGKEVAVQNAKRGDLILFTGTDSLERFVGHMGIVTSNTDSLRFIHSSSGKANGVTVTPLNRYYKGRFVKVIDIFN